MSWIQPVVGFVLSIYKLTILDKYSVSQRIAAASILSQPAAMTIAAGNYEDCCRQLWRLLSAAVKIAAGSNEDSCWKQ